MNLVNLKGENDHPFSEKLSFMINYYRFFITYAGEFSFTKILTPLSIITDIIHQLKFNTDKPNKRNAYIDNQIVNLSEITEHYSDSIFFELLEEVLLIKNRPPSYLENEEYPILTKLSNIEEILIKEQFDYSFKVLKSLVFCNCALESHLDEIVNCTKFIASEILIETESVEKAKTIFSNALTGDEFEFPFSQSFNLSISEQPAEKIQLRKKEYLKKLEWDNRFDAIKNYKSVEKQSRYYLLRLGNISSEEVFQVDYGNVQFYTCKTDFITHVKNGFSDDKMKEYFFTDEYSAFFVVKIEAYETENGFKRALNEASIWVEFINEKIEGVIYIDRSSYVQSTFCDFNNFGGSCSSGLNKKHLSYKNKKNLTGVSVAEFLKKCNSLAYDEFLKYESTYVAAKNHKDLGRYWQYFENIMNKNFCNRLSHFIVEMYARESNIKFDNLIYNFYIPLSGNDELGLLSSKEKKELIEDMNKSDFDFLRCSKASKNSFIRFLGLEFEKNTNADIEVYIFGLMTELRGVRNFIQHSGSHTVEAKSSFKLMAVIPNIAHVFRKTLLNKMKEDPSKNLKELLVH